MRLSDASSRHAIALLLIFGWPGAPGLAEAPPAVTPGALSWSDALQTTVRTGRPTLLVITAPEAPESLRLLEALREPTTARRLDSSVAVAVLRADSEPDPVRRMRVTTFPTLMIFRRNKQGVEWVATRDDLTTAPAVAEWLGGLGLLATAPTHDRAVQPAGLHHKKAAHASPQTPIPVPPPPPPQKLSPPVAPVVTVQPVAAPLVIAPAPAPIVIQQRPPTIVLAPAPPPIVYYASQPQPSPPQQPSNLFLSAQPGPSASPQTAPTAPAPAPIEPIGMTYLAAAPVQSIATATPPMALVLTNPGLLSRSVGALGRKLASFGNPRAQVAGLTGLTPVTLSGVAPAGQPLHGCQGWKAPAPSGQANGTGPIYFGQPPTATVAPAPPLPFTVVGPPAQN